MFPVGVNRGGAPGVGGRGVIGPMFAMGEYGGAAKVGGRGVIGPMFAMGGYGGASGI